MTVKLEAEIKLTPKQVAEAIFNMDSIQQAEMFEHLHDVYESDHYLGGIHGKAMSAFQTAVENEEERRMNTRKVFAKMIKMSLKNLQEKCAAMDSK